MSDIQPSETFNKYSAFARVLLDLVDSLREIGVDEDHVVIPQIAVVGDQSSGKSSVLESISGVSFPRGKGTTTTCATQISMKCVPAGTKPFARISVKRALESKGQHDELKGTGIVSDLSEIGNRIQQVSNALKAENSEKSFSQDLIIIKIESPDVPDLTLVDLPGIVRSLTDELSPTSVEDVLAIVTKYLEQEQTICLAVVPATQDVATVDVLDRARTYDPEGNRTIGVITKPDLVPSGEEDEKCSLVNNKIKPLKLGYTIVMNDGDSHDRKAESAFFENHAAYKTLPKQNVGTQSLIDKLSALLVERIKVFLPQLQASVESKLKETELALDAMGTKPPENSCDKMRQMITMLSAFQSVFEKSLNGVYTESPLIEREDLRICALSHEFYTTLQKSVNNLKPHYDSEETLALLESKLAKSRGEELPGFLSFAVFKQLVGVFIEEWRPLGNDCIDKVVDTALSAGLTFAANTCKSYYKFTELMNVVVQEEAEKLQKELKQSFDDLLKEQSETPYTQNHYFFDTVNKINQAKREAELSAFFQTVARAYDTYQPVEVRSDPVSLAKKVSEFLVQGMGNKSNQRQEAELMAAVLESYWKVASKSFLDSVPQRISTHFVKKLGGAVKNEMSVRCFHICDTLFELPEDVQAERTKLENRQKRLSEARKAIYAVTYNK